MHVVKPLEGILVVEFSHMVMGPSAGLVLADLGADVLKIEPIGGDNTRRLPGSGAGYFTMYNRNKRSMCLDVKSDAGKKLALRLIENADVFVENFRPGALEKLGFGYQQLSAQNERLIYCSLKGFLSGPYEHRTALDEVTQMMGGLAYMTGLPDRPMRAGSSVIDITGGMFGVIGILAALNERRETGRGRHVTSALFETTSYMVGQHMAQQAVLGEAPQPMSIRKSAWAVYDLFSCRGGEKLFVAVVSDTGWRALCEQFELDELAADESLRSNKGRVENRVRIKPVLESLFARTDREEVCRRLDAAGLPFAEINRPSDLFEDPHLNLGGLAETRMVEGNHKGETVRLPKLPLEIDGQRMDLVRDPPKAGEHSREVARLAGMDEAEIDALIEAGVLGEAGRGSASG